MAIFKFSTEKNYKKQINPNYKLILLVPKPYVRYVIENGFLCQIN